MSSRHIVVAGGAPGFFAAITCAEALSGASVTILEKGAQFLSAKSAFPAVAGAMSPMPV